MSPTSRAASQQRTREALVGTARAMFLRDGYAATSLDQVAEDAGFSKGAVYSNFRGKDELCLAVLDDMYARDIAAITEAVTAAAGVEGRVAAFESWAHRTLGAEGRTALGVEFAMRVRHTPEMREGLAALDRRMAEAIAELIERQAQDFGTRPLLPADVAASALLDLGIGIAVHRVVEPGLTVRALVETMRTLLGLPASGTGAS
jgi:AcrR family transcriptional regulator